MSKLADNKGRKADDGKLRWDLLLSFRSLEPVIRVLMHGAKEYGDENWREVLEGKDGARRYYAAMSRHAFAWWNGEATDPKSGESHLAHVICNALFLMETWK